MFLEASDDALVRRLEAVRRPHPLQGDGRLIDGIAREREMLRDLRAEADIVIDTTDLNVHELGAKVLAAFEQDEPGLLATVMSFGYKYGLPVDADLVVDCRFLPNPHWVPELRPLNGRDEPVRDYVLAQQGAAEFLETYERLLDIIGTGYQREGKRYATIAVGCTGGQAPVGRDGRGARPPAEDPRHRHRRRPPRPGARMSSPVPDAFSDAPAVVALGGGHGLAASLQALRRGRRPADRRGHGRRRRRLERPAAPRARRAATRRPADGAGRAVRRRRVGPDVERRRAAPLPQRG